jgi:serine/threonine-protein kinase SRPK3
MYVCVKVSEANSRQAARELEVYGRINSISTSHAGFKCVRTLLDTFNIDTATGSHICMVHKPLGLRISDFQELVPGERLPQEILKLTLKHVLLALDFLHSKCDLAHTGKFFNL